MKTKKSEFEYPEMNGKVNIVETRILHRPVKGRINFEEKSEGYLYHQNVNNTKIAGRPLSVKKNKLKGLCGNCDYADTCIYPKPVTGVWHCNEYH